jgi:hypothetical protein
MFLIQFTSERFGRESRKPSEERFGERFRFFGWKFQALLDFRFPVLKLFRGCDFRQSPEKHLVCSLPLLDHTRFTKSHPIREHILPPHASEAGVKPYGFQVANKSGGLNGSTQH